MQRPHWILLAVVAVVALLASTTAPTAAQDPTDPEPGMQPADPGMEPTDPSAEPTDPGMEPTDPGMEPTDPGTEPTDPGTEPTDPGTEPTDPGTEPTDPGTEPTDPGTEPTDPGTEPTDPGTEPTDPGTEPTDPGTEPTDPGTEPTDPGTEPTDPGTEPTDPGTEPTDPGTEPTDPGTEPTDPGTEPTDPGTEPTDPGTEPTDPGTEPTDPGTEPGAGSLITQESRRKNLAYFKMFVHPTLSEQLTQAQLDQIEWEIRNQIETLKRFEMVKVGVAVESLDEFVTAMQSFIKDNAVDIAQLRNEELGVNYDFEYQGTTVTTDDVRRVLNSAYAYTIALGELKIDEKTAEEAYEVTVISVAADYVLAEGMQLPAEMPGELRHNADTGNLVYQAAEPMTEEQRDAFKALDAETKEWAAAIDALFEASNAADAPTETLEKTRLREFFAASFPITISFYRVEIVDDAGNLVPVADAVVQLTGGMIERQANGQQQGFVDSREMVDEAAYQASREAGMKAAIDAAAQDFPGGLEVEVARIEEFKIRGGVARVGDGGFYIRKGRAEDLKVDRWIVLYAPTADGGKEVKGYGKIRALGPGEVAVADGTSAADSDLTYVQGLLGDVEEGLMFEEYALFGLQVDFYLGFEMALGTQESSVFNTPPGLANQITSASGAFTGNIFVGYDLGQIVELPELWAGVDATLAFGGFYSFYDIGLLAKKKFYFGGPFGLDVSVGFGFSRSYAGGRDVTDIAFFFLTGAGVSDAQAREDTFGKKLASPVRFYFKLQPRFTFALSPHVELFAQIDLRLQSAAASASMGERDFDGQEFNFINGFKWKTFGFALAIGGAFYF